jgi:glycine cleavage system H protein
MSQIFYTEEHEWIRISDNIATVGITDYAQQQLGDIVFVETPDIKSSFQQGEEIAVVESVKAASEIYAPASGIVIECNSTLNSHPEKVNSDPLGEGWFLKLSNPEPNELKKLMDQEAYNTFLTKLKGS